jgi:deoxyadenosine/deoxycytidine kinase
MPKLASYWRRRGRDYENSISIEYLENLNEQSRKWITAITAGRSPQWT